MADANKTLITLQNLTDFKTNYDAKVAEGYVAKEAGKGLSSNDFTNTLLQKLNGIAEGAQVNVLEGVQVNGSDLPITTKKVNIDLTPYALKSDIVAGVHFKGTANTVAEIPSEPAPAVGDIYIITTADSASGIEAGEAVIWDGTAWQDMGGTVSVDLSNYYNKTEADGKFQTIEGLDTAVSGLGYMKTTVADGKYQTQAGLDTAVDGLGYMKTSELAGELAGAGAYTATANPVATTEQIQGLFD